MEDIGKHPDHGKREPPELTPLTVSFTAVFTGKVAGWTCWSDLLQDVKDNLGHLIEDRGVGDGLLTDMPYEAELVEYQLLVEVE